MASASTTSDKALASTTATRSSAASISLGISAYAFRDTRGPIPLEEIRQFTDVFGATPCNVAQRLADSGVKGAIVVVNLQGGAARLLPAGGALCLYGPFKRGGRHTAPSNAAFDADLRASDPAWGVRDLEAVAAEAEARGFGAPVVEEMPANNLFVVFRRGGENGG